MQYSVLSSLCCMPCPSCLSPGAGQGSVTGQAMANNSLSSCTQHSGKFNSWLEKDFLCNICKDTTYLKESEFDKHMEVCHGVTTYLDLLYCMNLISKVEKDIVKTSLEIIIHQTLFLL